MEAEAASHASWYANPHWWVAIWTALLTLVTGFLVGVGLHQIRKIRDENRKSATLAACLNYESNPVIYESLKELWAASECGELKRNPKKFRTSLVMLLNYLDGIAIGINQGLFIEELAWDHMEGIVAVHVHRYIDSGLIISAGLMRQDWRCLVQLRDKWAEAKPRFKEERTKNA